MAGLFDTLSLGSRSLTTYRKAIDVTGHNLANVNTAGYTRQRLEIESVATSTTSGPVGSGAEGVRIVQIQNEFFNAQIQVENSVEGSLEGQSNALRQALNALGETIDRNSPSGISTGGISQGLADFFASMQSLSTNPESIPERQVVLQQAQDLATKFNRVDTRLAAVESTLNKVVSSEVETVNGLANDIAKLNAAIMREEAASDGVANDLRDARQLKLEELSRLVKVESVEQPDGSVSVLAGGVMLVEANTTPNTLETFDSGSGNLLVRAAGQTTALELTGGSIAGNISTRDGEVRVLRAQINELASTLLEKANEIHSAGFGLNGSSGENLFTGSNAADIQVNANLLGNPALFQASGQSGESGNNSTVLALARLGKTAHEALGAQSFSDRQAEIVASLGEKVAEAENDLADQQAISGLAKGQRESLSGVSLDEEMANLVMFQKAFQASAKLISMTDEMLQTIIQM
jgi:flagellar hook-associated protein 1